MTDFGLVEWVVLFGGAGREHAVTALQNSGRKVLAVVVPSTKSEKLAGSVQSLKDFGLNVIEVKKAEVGAALSGFPQTAILSIGFPYLLAKHTLEDRPINLNVHPTLLPKYRGPTTGFYIIENSDPVTGSTVHILDEGMDTGPIVAQSNVMLSKFDTVASMQQKVYAHEPALVLEAIAYLERGGAPLQQDESKATTYPLKRTPRDSEIDPNKPLIDLFDAIRAADPDNYPAYFYVDGERVCIRLWRPDREASEPEYTV